jgi:hypothetical protein
MPALRIKERRLMRLRFFDVFTALLSVLADGQQFGHTRAEQASHIHSARGLVTVSVVDRRRGGDSGIEAPGERPHPE